MNYKHKREKMKSKKILIVLLLIVTGCGVIPTSRTIPTGYSPISNSKEEMIYKRYDEFKDISFYRHKAFFKSSPIEIYFVESSSPFLRIEFTYYGSDWIFFESATIINSENSRVNIRFKSYDKDMDVLYSGNVMESIDKPLTDNDAMLILNLINDNKGEVKVRLSGKRNADYALNESQVKGLKDMLNKYFQ